MKEFGYPIPYEDFWEFCDPNEGTCFHRPFVIGDGEETGMANGWMVMRTVQAVHESDKVESGEAVKRLERLPWGWFEVADKGWMPSAVEAWERDWKRLRDRGGMLAGPMVPAWKKFAPRWELESVPRVAVGKQRAIFAVSILQLVRRLPNCEVFVSEAPPLGRNRRLLPFRFTGGKGFAVSVKMNHEGAEDGIQAKYGVWTPKVDEGIRRMGG